MAFHPVDSFLQSLPYHVFVFICPLHIGVYFTAVFLIMLWAVAIHDRLTFVPDGLVLSTGYHTVHHLRNHGSGVGYNYGQYTLLWDWIGGTVRKPAGVELVDVWAKEAKKFE
jgi:Delta7-sterol 5-desaturase